MDGMLVSFVYLVVIALQTLDGKRNEITYFQLGHN